MRIGTRKPNAAMLSAIWWICLFECVRALRGLGLSALIAIHCIVAMSLSSDIEAKRTRLDFRVGLQTKFC